MADPSEPESPLSSLASDEEMDEAVPTSYRSSRPSIASQDSVQPPSKRRKTGGGGGSGSGAFSTFSTAGTERGSTTAAAAAAGALPLVLPDQESDMDISSDSEASAPGSPSADEFTLRADMVTKCQWEGCPVGDVQNSDTLIDHVQDEHIAPKRARYTCEWGDCARKGTVHPSGYALKAHMRSHTKEKPFFCRVPECDRSFTRSDALAKHMRTVHEPDASAVKTLPGALPAAVDATPTATAPPATGKKTRKSLGANGKAGAGKGAGASASTAEPDTSDPNYDPSPANDNIQYIPARHPITQQPGFMITYPPDIHFSQFESEIPANQLMRLIRRQLHWAGKEAEQLKTEIDILEAERQQEWAKKEALLVGMLEGELEWAVDKGLVDADIKQQMKESIDDAETLQWSDTPAWKLPKRAGAAAVTSKTTKPAAKANPETLAAHLHDAAEYDDDVVMEDNGEQQQQHNTNGNGGATAISHHENNHDFSNDEEDEEEEEDEDEEEEEDEEEDEDDDNDDETRYSTSAALKAKSRQAQAQAAADEDAERDADMTAVNALMGLSGK